MHVLQNPENDNVPKIVIENFEKKTNKILKAKIHTSKTDI